MSVEPEGTRALVRLSLATAWRRRALWVWGAALACTHQLVALIFDRHRVEPEIRSGRSWVATVTEAYERSIQATTLEDHAISVLLYLLEVWLLVALTRAALNVLQGRSPGPILSSLRSRWKAILVFSAVFATGTLLFDLVKCVSARGALIGFLLSTAWTFSLYLGIPVLAREPATGLGAVRRAWMLIRLGWAKRLAGLFLIGVLSVGLWQALALLLALAYQFLARGSHEVPGWFPLYMALIRAPFLVVSMFFVVADQVFDAALYTGLTEGAFPELPSGADPQAVWRARS